MALVLRNTLPELATIAAAHNAFIVGVGAGANFHMDKCERSIAAANATDLATSLALCKELTGFAIFHLGDTLAHKVADATSLPTVASIVDLASAQTAANLIKATYNTHRASTTYHYNADATNTITSADATDQSSLNTLLNEMKTDIAAHTQSATASAAIRLVSA